MTTPTMSHEIEITRQHSDVPGVPDSIHLRCTCGWTSSAHDDAAIAELIHHHQADGVPAPPPSTISPD
jgi:hypothetical protein